MAFLKLHHKCKKTDAKIRALEAEIKTYAKQKETFIAEMQAELDKHSGETRENLIAQQKRAVVAEMAKITGVKGAWDVDRHSKRIFRSCSAPDCDDPYDTSNGSYYCVFDRKGPHRYCGECFVNQSFDFTLVIIGRTNQLKAAYLAKKNARPYMAGHQIACDT